MGLEMVGVDSEVYEHFWVSLTIQGVLMVRTGERMNVDLELIRNK